MKSLPLMLLQVLPPEKQLRQKILLGHPLSKTINYQLTIDSLINLVLWCMYQGRVKVPRLWQMCTIILGQRAAVDDEQLDRSLASQQSVHGNRHAQRLIRHGSSIYNQCNGQSQKMKYKMMRIISNQRIRQFHLKNTSQYAEQFLL
jgi:hypothetical protein